MLSERPIIRNRDAIRHEMASLELPTVGNSLFTFSPSDSARNRGMRCGLKTPNSGSFIPFSKQG